MVLNSMSCMYTLPRTLHLTLGLCLSSPSDGRISDDGFQYCGNEFVELRTFYEHSSASTSIRPGEVMPSFLSSLGAESHNMDGFSAVHCAQDPYDP